MHPLPIKEMLGTGGQFFNKLFHEVIFGAFCLLHRTCPCLPPTLVFGHEEVSTLVNIGWYPKVTSYNMLGEQPHYFIPGGAWLENLDLSLGTEEVTILPFRC